MIVYWDVETFSQVSLNDHGAHIYAGDPSTGIFFFCYAIDGGEVQTWWPGDPVPAPFANPTNTCSSADNWEFERAIHASISWSDATASRRFRSRTTTAPSAWHWPVPIPAELGLRCEALGLPYRKNPEARKAMLRLSRPQTAKKRKKPEDPAARERDLVLLLERCKTDVVATRAAYNSPRLQPLLPEERQQLLLDAEINARGIRANVPFLEAGARSPSHERNAVNTRLNELTAGVITSVDQVQRIKQAINARGHDMTSLGKRSVTATLGASARRLRA